MTTKRTKVCVIGAGPCGMSALFHFGQMGNQAPEVVCYEKGNTLAWTLEFYLDDGYVYIHTWT
jgi:cation diffusion facilitator CzcD-associated flavoprotein CzcO